ncbi:MAG: DUF2802 domain-containing protein [Candidatus Goldbacteria bacterium]|nr:DUF2802 domain-containing protein [Candidatus Goldiibacteriota bacterium]
MLIILIFLNIILIVIILYLLFFKLNNKNILFSNFEYIELLEFQKGLKELIDELNKIANTSINELNNKKKEIDDGLILIDSKIKELKYLIERNQVIRQTEYKKEIAYGKPEAIEKTDIQDITNEVKKQKSDKKNILETKMNKNPLKILIDEKNDEKLDNFTLKYSQIHNLLKNGMSIEEISKITGLTKGEIELIKNIKK